MFGVVPVPNGRKGNAEHGGGLFGSDNYGLHGLICLFIGLHDRRHCGLGGQVRRCIGAVSRQKNSRLLLQAALNGGEYFV